MNPIVVIPARLASSRLPGKPLADIHGRPMIAHVLDRAREADVGPVLVACGDAEIATAVEAEGGLAVMTDPDLPTGSDRIEQALGRHDPEGRHDVVVNLQGDLPVLPAALVHAAMSTMADPDTDIGSLVAEIRSAEEATAPSVVKCVCAFREHQTVARAHYFSRSIVPGGTGPLWHHIGLYVYRRIALERFVRLPPGLLEKRESLEQLRALEAGMRISVARVDHAPFGVDTPADLDRVRAMLAERAS